MLFLYILLTILVLFLLSKIPSLLKRFKLHKKLKQYPKLPFKHYPVIGHILGVPSDANEFFWTVQDYNFKVASKEKFAVFWAALKPNFLLFHPDSVEAVLKSTVNIRKNVVYDYLRPFIRDGLITSAGRKWHRRRKMITPSFHFEILNNYFGIMNEHTELFVNRIEEGLRKGEKVDLQHCVQMLTLDVICETAMGYKLRAQDNENNQYVNAVQESVAFVVQVDKLLFFL